MSDDRRFPEICPDEALTLYTAAIVGDAEFADQLVRLGISNERDALIDATRLRPEFLVMGERAMAGEDPGAAIWQRIARRIHREVRFPERMPSVEEVADALAAALNEDPVTMSSDPDRDLSPEDVMEKAEDLHESMQAIREEHYDDSDRH